MWGAEKKVPWVEGAEGKSVVFGGFRWLKNWNLIRYKIQGNEAVSPCKSLMGTAISPLSHAAKAANESPRDEKASGFELAQPVPTDHQTPQSQQALGLFLQKVLVAAPRETTL